MIAPGLQLTGSCYVGSEVLFSQLSLDIVASQWTCLLGASGVGKSTLLRLIADLPTGGRFDGAIECSDGDSCHGRIAYMAQSDLLAPWLNVRDNVLLGARLRHEKSNIEQADALIERVGLAAHAGKYPTQLSGGMRQRAALARTLIEERPIALLDEPFSALDAATRADMQDLAAELLIDKTVLLVTHDPAEAVRLGHRVFLLDVDGVHEQSVPDNPPIRSATDELTLRAQARLLSTMRDRNT